MNAEWQNEWHNESGKMNAKKRKLCEISDREEANMESSHGELQQQNKTELLQFDIECLQRENLQLRAEVGRNYGLIQALETALRNVRTDNERQRAELGRKDEKIEALKSFIRSLSL